MSISFNILGRPGRDNALLLRIDSGQTVNSILFDCGDCLNELKVRELQAIDHLFFSHMHIDHIAGFDQFFRCNYSRENKENHIWGPPGTSEILHHRLQGYQWNLCADMKGTWFVHDYDGKSINTYRFELNEGFRNACFEGATEVGECLYENELLEVHAYVMDHKCPCLAFRVVEKVKENINMARLKEAGLESGRWIGELKSGKLKHLEVGKTIYSAEELRTMLIDKTPGDSIGYLTDFLLNDEVITFLEDKFRKVQVLVCEAQYRGSDIDLAKRNFHMTTELSGELARRAEVNEMILFHLSDRYSEDDWVEMLNEAKERFPNVNFPADWEIAKGVK